MITAAEQEDEHRAGPDDHQHRPPLAALLRLLDLGDAGLAVGRVAPLRSARGRAAGGLPAGTGCGPCRGLPGRGLGRALRGRAGRGFPGHGVLRAVRWRATERGAREYGRGVRGFGRSAGSTHPQRADNEPSQVYVPAAEPGPGLVGVGGVGVAVGVGGSRWASAVWVTLAAVTTEPTAAPATGPVVADWPQLGRVWRSDRPLAVSVILATLRHGGGDPTFLRGRGGSVARGLRTPDGLATLELQTRPRTPRWSPGRGGRGRTGRWTAYRTCSVSMTTCPGSSRTTTSSPGGAAVHRVAGAALAAGPRVARTGDHRAEGDRQGGVRGVPAAGPPVRGAGARPVCVGRAAGAAVAGAVGGDPVVAVPQGVGRPGALADAGRRGTRGRAVWSKRST